MNSLSKLKQRFGSSPTTDTADTILEAQEDGASPAAEPAGEPEKPSHQLEVGGIAKLEAAQAVWGQTGRYFLYFG